MSYYRSIICTFVLLNVFCAPMLANAEETMSVQVKESVLRATPSFLGKIVANVAYGDRVIVIEKSGAWKKVSLKGGSPQGWISSSALTTKKIVLKAGQASAQTGASQNELALAGKGFNEQVEASFKNQNKKLDYAWINRMETFKVMPELMNTFLAQGEVFPSPEGGVQ
jgi:hypothetical protein